MAKNFKLTLLFKIGFAILFLIYFSNNTYSQNKINNEINNYYTRNVVSKMDTNYINFEVENWSLRAYSVYKTNVTSIYNSADKLYYTPNNPFSIGLGFAYYPFLLDLGFNIKPKNKNKTQRFDLQADITFHNNYFGIVIQRYQGFNVSDSEQNYGFREDIITSAIDLSYAYLFSGNKMSLGSVFSGSQIQKKSAGSFSVGAFFMYNKMSADSSIIPTEQKDQFSALYGYTSSENIGGGINIGYSQIFVLAHHFFVFGAAGPGIGLLSTELTSSSSSFIGADPLIYKLNLNFSVGYNGPKYYVVLAAGDHLTFTSISSEDNLNLNTGKAKLIFGYKFIK